MKLEKRVESFIRQHRLLKPGAEVLVALSGGADSVALLRMLLRLGYVCHAVHCNFHLRGEESDRDEQFVTVLCQELSVFPLHLNYRGGTIIGDSEDLSFLILCPLNLKFNSGFILQGIKLILSQYFENVTILGNDILIDNKKICGAMSAEFNNCFLWGAQIS